MQVALIQSGKITGITRTKMKEEREMTLREIRRLRKESVELGDSVFGVQEGTCKDCRHKLVKKVEDRTILNGAATFHIIKLKCPRCGKEYLDLDQAEKYDFFLALEKVSKEKPLATIAKKIIA